MIAKPRPPVWVVVGPLNPKKLPKRCVVERVPEAAIELLAELLTSAKQAHQAARRRRNLGT